VSDLFDVRSRARNRTLRSHRAADRNRVIVRQYGHFFATNNKWLKKSVTGQLIAGPGGL